MLETGELIELDNNETYIVMNNLEYNNKNYVMLMTDNSPISIKIAIQEVINDEINITIVENSQEIEEVIKYMSK